MIKKDIKVEGLEMEVQALRIHLSKIPPGEELSEEARNLRYVPFRCLMVALKIPDLVMGESINKGCKKVQVRQS